MLNGALYRQGLRASWKPLIIFLAVLTMYDAVIVSMFAVSYTHLTLPTKA